MDIFHKVEHTEHLVRNLPTPDVFEAYVRSLGVSDDSDVILYDRAESGCGYMSSGRAWFLFKVSMDFFLDFFRIFSFWIYFLGDFLYFFIDQKSLQCFP